MKNTDHVKHLIAANLALDEMYKKSVTDLHGVTTQCHLKNGIIENLMAQNNKLLEEKSLILKELEEIKSIHNMPLDAV